MNYMQEAFVRKDKLGKKQKANSGMSETEDIVFIIKGLERELEFIHASLDNVTDPSLIDSFVFELKAIHMRYEYYMRICKDKDAITPIADVC